MRRNHGAVGNMTVYTLEARKKYFKTKYNTKRIEELQELIDTYTRKASWLSELIEEKQNTKRRK